jgi:cytochrome oxidase Cu insertion factor (SCO1/SenC/PrrC family)
VTGPPQAVQAVWQAFGLTVKPRATGVVDHPAWTFLIDREGMVQYRYLGSLLEVETIREDMEALW